MGGTGTKSTKYASAERSSKEEVLRQKRTIEISEFLDQVLAQTPFMFFILNEHRQVVYSNYALMEHLGYKDMNDMAGSRAGELFRCIHADEEPGGCGTSESCRYCGAIQAVLESKRKKKLVIREAVLTLNQDGKRIGANYEVSSKPFHWKGEDYYIVTLEDHSTTKRKEQLERTFFHDIRNKAATVQGFLNLLMDSSHKNNEQFLELAARGMKELLLEIEYQRVLVQAESGDLRISKIQVSVQDMLNSVSREYHVMAIDRNVEIRTVFDDGDLIIYTDPVLLKRVLANMFKNAVEASSDEERVVISYTADEDTVDLVVQNPAVMPEEIRLQVFNKSFSTKGDGRGIGTYSIKLLSEEYLDGKVSFTSEAPDGTEFRVSLPLNDESRM